MTAGSWWKSHKQWAPKHRWGRRALREGGGKRDPPHSSDVSLVNVLLDGKREDSISLWVTYSNLQPTHNAFRNLPSATGLLMVCSVGFFHPHTLIKPFPCPSNAQSDSPDDFLVFPLLIAPAKRSPCFHPAPVQDLCVCTDWEKVEHRLCFTRGKWWRLERGLAF